jgi:hypothetical protein
MAVVIASLPDVTMLSCLRRTLQPDGAGFHEIANGGRLGLHVDFRIHGRLRLQRRLNLLLYLNKSWQDSYGGHFEMWDKAIKQRVHRVAPLFNRCVIFNTDNNSWHGHPEPLNTPPGVTRKSMALYYYTASHTEDTPRMAPSSSRVPSMRSARASC